MDLELINFIIEKNLSLSCAESCTGGLLTAEFVKFSGASKFFYEGIIAYSNKAKIKRLGVNKNILKKFGAVSKEVAIEMLKNLETDICISSTGVAGPNKDDFNNKVGLVYIGLKIKDEIFVNEYNFSGSRSEIQIQAVNSALDMLKNRLQEFDF